MKAVLITSSILIVLIAALRPVLRGRIDPRVQYALWLIVALRLLVPVELAPSTYSALALLERVEERSHLAETIGQFSIPGQSYQSAWNQALSEFERDGGIPSVANAYEDLDTYERVEYRAHALMEGPTLSRLAEQYARPLWLGGAAVMELWFLLVNLRLRRRLCWALPVETDCPLPVRVTPELPSPCLCGVVRPTIYVTPAALESPERLRHVLAHELTHYHHRDHWWALVRCLCLCLYWFDPLVWWAAALSRQDCELACDEGAIRRLGEGERLPYGRTLVDMIAAGRTSLLQTATTMTGGKRRVRERIRLIARKPKTVIAAVLALVLVLGLAVGCTFTGAPEQKGPTPTGLSVDTLRERLNNIPLELQGDVVTGNGHDDSPELVNYWMNREWTNMDNSGLGYLLRVEEMTQAELDNYRDTGGWECFARRGNTYYALFYATDVRFYSPDDAEPFHNAFEAIREFAIQTLLDTEGVEPYTHSSVPSQPVDTLRAQLNNIPEELRSKVDNDADVYNDTAVLANYWLNDPMWQDLWSGYLLTLYRMDETRIQNELDQGHWPAVNIFARSGEEYYALTWPADGRYQDNSALSDEYWDALNTLTDYVKQTVLDTEGVEPFDPYTTPPHFYSNVKKPPLDPGTYAIQGMDYTPVNSYDQIPEDPGQWYLAGYMPDIPVWMFTRGSGEETMFQVGDHLTQIFPYRPRFYGGGYTPDGKAPQLRPLDGFAWGPKGISGPFAVVTHIFQGGTDGVYQLTVYDVDGSSVVPYVHDCEPLMEDFNEKRTTEIDAERRVVSVSYEGQTAEIAFDENDAQWPNILEYGYAPEVYEMSMTYSINYIDGLIDVIMPVWGPPMYSACWTVRFTGSGFETVGFRFIETAATGIWS
ncbi:MAG: M56 family metallopeptidase [Oscillospiraceae bacterium]|nr:M56 family metallopeptidase [Oscillospiraceae bacterium]